MADICHKIASHLASVMNVGYVLKAQNYMIYRTLWVIVNPTTTNVKRGFGPSQSALVACFALFAVSQGLFNRL